MSYEGWISYRYLTTKKDSFVSIINFIAIAGIAIGVTALIVVIGVMTGFDRDLREKIIGTYSHIVVEKETGIKEYENVRRQLSGIGDITATTPYVSGNVFLETEGSALGLNLRGIDPASAGNVTDVASYLEEGDLRDLAPGEVVVGSELAKYFGFRAGDEVTLIAPASGVRGEGWRYKLTIAGIFSSGMYDYDMNLILVHLGQAQKIFGTPADTVSGIAIRLENIYEAAEVKDNIYETLGYSFLVRTWIELNRNFFAALRLEKFGMFVILTLIVLVASFNIVSTLIVTVTSKIKDIGILKSLGVPKRSIRRIFTLEGLAIGLIGTFWGLVGGVALSWVLKKYQFIKLPPDIYYIDRLPVILELGDILVIVSAAMVISYLATIYPAAKAASLQPVDALRYE